MLNRELEGLLAAPFTQDGFTSLMREILPGWQPAEVPVHLTGTERAFIVQATSLGTASDGDAGLDLDVLVVELASGHSVHSSRSVQRALLTRLLRQQQREAALAAFYCRDSGSWRLSFVHLTWQRAEDGKVKTEVLAPLRRYSFVVGRGEPVHTATSQLLHLLELQQTPTLEDIEQTFSIDRVTKEFYQRIAILFSQLTGGQRKVGSKLVTYNPQLHLPSVSDPETLQRFAVRLIGRLLFAWFLTKKHSDKWGPLMPPDLLSVEAVKRAINGKQLYYHDVLERMFFEVLNTPVDKRTEKWTGEPWSLVPYLSSGLFEAQKDDSYVLNETGQSQFYKSLTVPNSWLNELLDLFSEYNFTIDENLSVDVDLAIEPEMLGRVFENLLAEINPETGQTARKATGSYYTPRTVVDFMVDEALRSYLLSQTSLTEEQATSLLSYDADDTAALPQGLCDEVLDAFDRMTALDPACGSGAFPMGILQKSLLVLGRVDPGSQRWAQRQLDHIADVGLRDQLRDKLQREEREFVHKIGLVRNCIYGVDIQPIAVEMSKLRFLLSLMVDESIDDTLPNRGILPLPNLEFKFACANTLVSAPGSRVLLFKGQKDQFALGLQDTTLAYFDTADPAAKKVLRAEIERLVDSKVKQEVDQTIRLAAAEERAQTRPGFSKANQEQLLHHVHEGTLWQSYRNIFTGATVAFFEIEYFFPSVRNGFDIVIGNPPYLEARSPLLTAEQKDLIRTSMYERWPTTDNLPPRGSDLMVYFFERGLSLLQPKGVMLYITENSWLSTDYGKSLQEFLVKSTHVKYVLDSDYRYFSDQDGPAINTVVTFCDGRNPSPSARTLLLRAHESLDQVRAVALLQESTLETPRLTCVSFAPNDPRYSAWKWSTLAVGGPPFLDIVDVLSREAVAMSRITASAVHAGQGLNLTRELINQGPIGQEGQLHEGARSLFTSLDGAPFVLSGTTAWILDARSLKSSASRTRGARDAVPVDIGDSRQPAALILPRGIGRYYCCLNRVLAYSDSNVEVYVDPGARSASANEVTDDLWLFLNSSLGWLLREVCGRANLGGGLLKAEATDLDSIPLYHRFAEHNRIGRLMSQLEKRQALSPLQEVGTPEHQEIDRLVFSELRFDSDTALTVMNLLTSLISGRQRRAASVRG